MSSDSTGRGGHGRDPKAFENLVRGEGMRHEVGARIARWVMREPEKASARAFGVSPRTVKSWRAGQLPQMRHLMAMTARWGEAFLDDVFAPVLVHDAGLPARLERLEAEIAAIRRDVTRQDAPAEGPGAEDERPGPDALLAKARENKSNGGSDIAIDGRALPRPKRWEAYRDDSRNLVEVAWFGLEAIDFDTEEMQTFARAMGSVAGGPPSWETVSTNTRFLTAVHLVDVTASTPDDYHFRRLGWTGIDMHGVTRLGSIPAEALRINAQHSYLDVKVFGEPSYSFVTRKLGTGDSISYSRLIWPALSGHGNQLLWVGIRCEQPL